jgi:hypothetical protein
MSAATDLHTADFHDRDPHASYRELRERARVDWHELPVGRGMSMHIGGIEVMSVWLEAS